MEIPKTTRGWKIQGTAPDDGSNALIWEENCQLPPLGPTEVLVKFHAWSINYPELAIANGTYPWVPENLINPPGSDGAGEIIATGTTVRGLEVGDRVFPVYYPNFDHGRAPNDLNSHGVSGTTAPGVFTEFGVFDERALIVAPRNLSYEEIASLPCSALTAWNALYGYAPIKPGSWILAQGTGGVSMFTIQFALAAGATVIATTGSEEKVPILKNMGVQHIINYKEVPAWGEVARRLTPHGLGCDHIIEVGGPSTIKQSFECVARGGVINVIGFLEGQNNVSDGPSYLEPLVRACIVRGVEVGSREQLEDMIKAIEAKNIHPTLDTATFTLKQMKDVYRRVWNRQHFGKVVVSGI